MTKEQSQHVPAEEQYAEELKALQNADKGKKPENWNLSPQSVVDYIMGVDKKGLKITPKYFGNRRRVEIAVATLATDRALLLIGVPGTAKTWLSEHLTAAISGDSHLIIQGSSGVHEEHLTYGWNYARLISEGPSHRALVPSPIMRAMENGNIARIEELTRISSDVQDTLLMTLSEKIIPIPELNDRSEARPGFNIIATANEKDRGTYSLSSALQRRFNSVYMPLPTDIKEEVEIVLNRTSQYATDWNLVDPQKNIKQLEKMVQVFKELREGKTIDGKAKVKSPSNTLSTAEIISSFNTALTLATYYGDGSITEGDLITGMEGALIKNSEKDLDIINSYLDTVVRARKEWKGFYEAAKKVIDGD